MPLNSEMHPRIDKQGEDTAQSGAVSTLALFPLVSPCYSTLLYSYIGAVTKYFAKESPSVNVRDNVPYAFFLLDAHGSFLQLRSF